MHRSGLTALDIRIALTQDLHRPLPGFDFEFYWVFFVTRATNSSSFESKSFKIEDWFDFL